MTQATADAHVDLVFSRISGRVDLGHVTESADIIIEAIVEDLAIKLPFFEGATPSFPFPPFNLLWPNSVLGCD